ncbi:MAG: GspH/FimT family pseudopilin [Acidobacteria bacterium]|nr:GspH/FimT family pseudopilin [Acidobacteriota bacterium]
MSIEIRTKLENYAGYSLTELVIVLACVTVLLAAAVPNIIKFQKEWSLWGGARMLETSMQWGRMHAITSNTPVLFGLHTAHREFFWTDALSGECFVNSVRRLPNGIRFGGAPRSPVRFYQHGNAAPAGTYTVEGDAGSYSVIVSPGGRIRIQKNR